MNFNSISLAWRNLSRNKAFTLINIAGLSIGITCALVVSIFIRYELSFDQYHKKSSQIFNVVQDTKMNDELHHWNTTAYPLAEALRNDFQELSQVTQCSGPVSGQFTVKNDQGMVSRFEEGAVLYVDPFYPKVFDFNWIQGTAASAFNEPNSIVLTNDIAIKYFGSDYPSKSILGREVVLDDRDPLLVTGVIEDMKPTTSLKYAVLLPYELFARNNEFSATNWSGNYQGTTFIILKEGVAQAEFENTLLRWKKKYLKPQDDARISYRLRPLGALHTDEQYGSPPHSYTMPLKYIYASAGVAVFMLIIAAVNFINLATAQAANRAREVGVRKVLGSSRAGLVKQFLSEHVMLVSLSLMISFPLTQMSLEAVNQLLAILKLQLSLDFISLGVALIVGIIIIIMACVYPAIIMSSYRPVEALKNKIFKDSGGLSLRRSLIVIQFSVVQVFLIGSIVVSSQMDFLKRSDLGFDKDQPVLLATVALSNGEAFRQRLLQNPAVEDMTFSSGSPLSEYDRRYGTTFRLAGQPEEAGKEAEEKGVDMNFLAFYDLQLIAGRNFSAMHEQFNEFIVNEKLIRALNLTAANAIGQKLIINEGEATIVGVVKDFHNNSLLEEISPCVLLNSSQWTDRANIKIQSADLSKTMLFIEGVWKELHHDAIFSNTFLDESIAQNYAVEQIFFQGFTVFSVITVIIGCLGLIGLLTFVTQRKTKEIAIRKSLGASVAQITGLFGKEFIALITVAFVIAAPLSHFWMSQWLSGFAYRIDQAWWMFALGAISTILIALITISYQAIASALANPVHALRRD